MLIVNESILKYGFKRLFIWSYLQFCVRNFNYATTICELVLVHTEYSRSQLRKCWLQSLAVMKWINIYTLYSFALFTFVQICPYIQIVHCFVAIEITPIFLFSKICCNFNLESFIAVFKRFFNLIYNMEMYFRIHKKIYFTDIIYICMYACMYNIKSLAKGFRFQRQ